MRVSRRLTVALAGLLPILAGMPAHAATADTAAPEVASISLSRETITVVGTDVQLLTVGVRLTDDVGVVEIDEVTTGHTPYLLFGSRRVAVNLVLGTGTAQDGVWTGVVAVTSDWAAQEQPVRVGAQDDAGNVLDVDPRTVIETPAVAVQSSHMPVIDLTVTPDPVMLNGAVTRTVRVTDEDTGRPWPDLPVFLADDASCAEDVIGTTNTRTDSNGRYQHVLPAGRLYREVMCAWVPGANVPGQRSTRIGGDIAFARYKLLVRATPAAASVPAGVNVDVNGQVVPTIQGKVVLLQRLSGTEWRTVGRGATRASSRFTVVATPPGVGLWSYRVYAPGDEQHAGSMSPTFTIRGT
jgi:hypothetical protein